MNRKSGNVHASHFLLATRDLLFAVHLVNLFNGEKRRTDADDAAIP
jgi:hypothetical protein